MRSAIALLMLASQVAHAAPQGDWWDADWDYRQKLTIDTSGKGLTESLTNFPVMIRLRNTGDGALVDFGKIEDDAKDVRFVITTNGTSHTVLPYDIEDYSEAGGRAVFHVRIPSLPASGTVDVWLYHGNSAATAPTNSTQVWSENFEAVWHVDSSRDLTDVTGNGRHKGYNGDVDVTAWDNGYYATLSNYESCYWWNGDRYCDWYASNWGNYTNWDTGSILGEAAFASASYWFRTTITSGSSKFYNSPGILGARSNTSDNEFYYGYFDENGKLGFEVPKSGSATGPLTSSAVTSTTVWHHAFMRRDRDGGILELYVDGALVEQKTSQSTEVKTKNANLVGGINYGYGYYGNLDEIRISSDYRSASWAKAEYVSAIDGFIDYENDVSYYIDADNDGEGDENGAASVSVEPYGWVTNNDDCDDGLAGVYTGADEICDNIDNDCNGAIDDGAAAEFYTDADGDGLGTGALTPGASCADPGPGLSAVDGDCDDTNPNILGPTAWWPDTDSDGVGVLAGAVYECDAPTGFVAPGASDCNPTDGTIYPGGQEICDSGNVDEDCDGNSDDADPSASGQTAWYIDGDVDTFGAGAVTMACDRPTGRHVGNNTDCDDTDATEFPGQQWYVDGDTDTYGAGSAITACERPAPTGFSLTNDDCDDSDAFTNPDTTWYNDTDGDSYGDFSTATASCTSPGSTWVLNGDDCNDSNPNDQPDTEYWPDADGDGYGDSTRPRLGCTTPSGYVASTGQADCDDTVFEINPGVTDTSCDGVDDNCDGEGGTDWDWDGDGKTWNEELALGADDCKTDSDGDGVGDIIEFTLGDTDNDGAVNAVDADDDNDNVPTRDEDYCISNGTCIGNDFAPGDGDPSNDDTDGDGIKNYIDADDDGDGINTVDEDVNRNSDPTDDNSDSNHPDNADLIPDYLDEDDEGDGVPTLLEFPYGTQYETDADYDTVDDLTEWGDINGPARDTDSDNTPDILDTDDDGDNISTFDEGAQFVECVGGNDGIPPYLDDDTDGDGVLDIVEGLNDADSDGLVDYRDCDALDGPNADQDTDGVANRYESPCLADRQAGALPTEGTACPGYECLDKGEPDSDHDGIHDGVEIGPDPSAPRDSDGDGIKDVCDDDDDGDGALSSEENSVAYRDPTLCIGGSGCATPPNLPAWPNLADEDNDGTPNYLDTDDDGDGIASVNEDYNGNGSPHDDDIDWDNKRDYLDADETDGVCGDADGDSLPTWLEEQIGSDPNSADTDGDGVPDDVEYGQLFAWDGYTSETHCNQSTVLDPVNFDDDALADFNDPDDDNDGVPTAIEGAWDADGDGIPNHYDDDSDGDGIPDAVEGYSALDDDGDCDGLPDYIDPDNDDNYCGDTGLPVDTGGPLDEGDCGCQTSGAGSSWLILLALPLLRRRRSD